MPLRDTEDARRDARRRLATDRLRLGIEFLLPGAVDAFAQAGQEVDGDLVKLDPDFVLEQVAKAPREFDVQARNPEHSLHIGGDHMSFASVYGPPFVREGAVRRNASMEDFENFCKLSQTFPQLDSAGGTIVEPEDTPLDSRHLDMVLALQTLTDKPYMGSVTSAENAKDTIAMGEILFGGREAIEAKPVSISLINVNSPLRYDDRMLGAMLEYVRAGQPVVITPFLLMGAMSPVSVPAALTQQMAEARRIALAQLIGPGRPYLRLVPLEHGHAVRLSELQARPSLRSASCTGQIARHFGFPWRSGGGPRRARPRMRRRRTRR